MRKHLVWVLGVTVALAVGMTGIASATNTQTMDVTVTPSKVSKNNFTAAKLRSLTVTGCKSPCGGAGAIKPVTKAQIFYDKNIKFDSTGIKQCKASQIENTTTQQAKAKCAASLVGSGKATVKVGGDPNSGDVNAVITAFNGQPAGGKPVILLHTRVDAIGQTTVLRGTLNNVSGKYGFRLDVVVPQLPLNTAATLFDVKVARTTHAGGKTHHLITGRCGDANRTEDFKGTFEYAGAPPITVIDTDKCTVR